MNTRTGQSGGALADVLDDVDGSRTSPPIRGKPSFPVSPRSRTQSEFCKRTARGLGLADSGRDTFCVDDACVPTAEDLGAKMSAAMLAAIAADETETEGESLKDPHGNEAKDSCVTIVKKFH